MNGKLQGRSVLLALTCIQQMSGVVGLRIDPGPARIAPAPGPVQPSKQSTSPAAIPGTSTTAVVAVLPAKGSSTTGEVVAELPSKAPQAASETGIFQTLKHEMTKLRDGGWRHHLPYRMLALEVVVSWAILLVLSLLVWALVYPTDMELRESFASAENDPVKTFTSSYFGCFSTPRITLCACLCPALRWADTMQLANIIRFPSGFAAFMLCALLNGLTCNWSIIYGFFTCVLILYNRQKLRAKLHLRNWTCTSCCIDFFFVFCCTCCAIAQEARVVKYAYQHSMMGPPVGSFEPPPRFQPAPPPSQSSYAYRSEVPQLPYSVPRAGYYPSGTASVVTTRFAPPTVPSTWPPSQQYSGPPPQQFTGHMS